MKGHYYHSFIERVYLYLIISLVLKDYGSPIWWAGLLGLLIVVIDMRDDYKRRKQNA